jgi:hypothetical protein
VFLAMVRSSPRRTTSRMMHLNEDSSDSVIREAIWALCSRATALVLSDASAIGLSAVQNYRLAAFIRHHLVLFPLVVLEKKEKDYFRKIIIYILKVLLISGSI